MDDQKLLPPLARGDSKRADPNKLSILDLPGETRNQIFGYLVPIKSPMIISCDSNPLRMRLGHRGVRIPVNLLAICRTLYREVVSAFYSGNSFLMKASRGWCPNPNFKAYRGFDIELPIAFLTQLGSQAHWLRKVILDLEALDITKFFRGDVLWYGVQECAADGGPALFEITPLLRAFWKMGPAVEFSFAHNTFLTPGRAPGMACNAPAMSAMFRSLLEGQLRLREQDRLMGAVSLNRDGSGGAISWGISHFIGRVWSHGSGRIASDDHYTSRFIAEDGGARFRMIKREKPLALLDLPRPLYEHIFEMIVRPGEGHKIDLSKDKKTDCGLIDVSWKIGRAWRERLLFDNAFELVLTTDRASTSFDQFDLLRRFVRKTFNTGGFEIQTRTVVSGPGAANSLKYVLKFELQNAMSLSDIRISILPLVMETSTTSGEDKVIIQVWATDTEGYPTMVSSHTLTLRELRLSVITTIMTTYYVESKELAPNIWINGFGEVVQVENVDEAVGPAWESASELVANDNDDGGFKLRTLHPMDVHYGFDHLSWKKNVTFSDDAQFFPFRRKIDKILPYLIKVVVDRAGLYKAMLGA